MPKRNLIWIGIVVATAALSVFLARAGRRGSSADRGRFDDVRRAYGLLRDRYYGEFPDEAIRRGAVEGMIACLDEYSSYVPEAQVESFDHRVLGRDRGLGLRLQREGGMFRTLWPLYGSPAYRRKIPAGMTLLSVDGRSVSDLSQAEVRSLLDGELGTRVSLLLAGPGGRRFVTLEREEFPLQTVQGFRRESDLRWSYWIDSRQRIGYVRITELVRGTTESLREVLQNHGSAVGWVLDLRQNPGGLLEEAIRTCNTFLSQGVIVTVVESAGPTKRHEAREYGTQPDVPIVLLIDENTASAAEIVAGALSYHGRGVTVGKATRGKGYIQTMFALPGDLGQVNLTTGEFLIGYDVSITRRNGSRAWGVQPQVVQPQPDDTRDMLRKLRWEGQAFTDEDTDRSEAEGSSDGSESRARDYAQRLLAVDAQLARAVGLLNQPSQMEPLLRQARERAAEDARRRAEGSRTDDSLDSHAEDPS